MVGEQRLRTPNTIVIKNLDATKHPCSALEVLPQSFINKLEERSCVFPGSGVTQHSIRIDNTSKLSFIYCIA